MNRIKAVLHEKETAQTWETKKLGKCFNIPNDYCNNRKHPHIGIKYEEVELLSVDVKNLLLSNEFENDRI